MRGGRAPAVERAHGLRRTERTRKGVEMRRRRAPVAEKTCS